MTRALETANEINKYHNKELIISRDIAEVNKIIFDKNPEDKDKLKANTERAKKTINYFKKILNANKRCVLIVAHGNVIRVILGYLMNKNIKDSPYMSLGNCSISAVAIDKKKLSGLLFLGCTEHLKKKETIKEKLKRVFYN